MARGGLRQRAGDLQRAVGLLHNGCCLGQKCRAFRCQSDAPPVAFEELQSQLAFQAANLLAQARLGDEQAPRGAGVVELGGDRDKVAKVSQLHRTQDRSP